MAKSYSKVRYDVMLTREGVESLKEEVVYPMLRKEKYFNCTTVEQNGYLLDMVVVHRWGDGIEDKVELSIPVHFVLFILSTLPDKRLGFGADDL